MSDHQLLPIQEAYEEGLPGWTPDAEHMEETCRDLKYQSADDALASAGATADDSPDEFHPWLIMLAMFLAWKRAAQGIGDCVSWGWELGAFILACMEGKAPPTYFATEAIYGGSRVEALGKKSGGWGDGSNGSWAAKWVLNYGILLRKDYSGQTGNPEHDLTTYSSKKAKDFGYYGCGGSKDSGKLDELAREHPIQDIVLVKSVEDAKKLCKPIPVCSNVGYGRMARNEDGVVRRSGSWAHCMLFAGHWVTSKYGILLRQFQSWGKSCSGPDPKVEELIRKHFAHEPKEVQDGLIAAVSACSWWTTPEDANAQLKQGDSFAIAGVKGWAPKVHDHVLI